MNRRPLLALAEHPLDCDPAAALRSRSSGSVLNTSLSATPVLISADYVERLRRLSGLLDMALRGVVGRYFEDERIRAIYDLDPALEAVLRLARARPYSVGFYRPDFIYDRDGQPRICEIGARYPMNGWMVSRLAASTVSDSLARASLRAQPQLDAAIDLLRSRHPPLSRVVMVHASEAGTEMFCLRDELREHGVDFVQAHPSELVCEGDDIMLRGARVDRIILELDRSELPLLDSPVLARMIASGNYFNDVRTLILVHDKRVLAVLSDPAIMRDCMDAAAYAELRRFLIPTWTLRNGDACAAGVDGGGNLIAKLSSGGRGIGACVRDECAPGEWEALLRDRWRDYVFQDYLDQRTFRDPDTGGAMHLVGMQLCHDQQSYGPGIFRGSNESVINVHQGRGRLFIGATAP